MIGREKLGLHNMKGDCLLFDESDGTEVDEDDILLCYEKGSVFMLAKNGQKISQHVHYKSLQAQWNNFMANHQVKSNWKTIAM